MWSSKIDVQELVIVLSKDKNSPSKLLTFGDIMMRHQKMDKISENKLVQQLKLSANVNKNCCSPNPIFSKGS